MVDSKSNPPTSMYSVSMTNPTATDSIADALIDLTDPSMLPLIDDGIDEPLWFDRALIQLCCVMGEIGTMPSMSLSSMLSYS